MYTARQHGRSARTHARKQTPDACRHASLLAAVAGDAGSGSLGTHSRVPAAERAFGRQTLLSESGIKFYDTVLE